MSQELPRSSAARAHLLLVGMAIPLVLALVFRSTDVPAKKQEPGLALALIEHRSAPAAIDAQTEAEAEAETLLQTAMADPLPVPEASDWITVQVRRGQTLSTILEAQSLPTADWVAISRLKGEARRLTRLVVGDRLNLRKRDDRLEELTFAYDESHTLHIRREGNGFSAITLEAQIEARPAYAIGVVRNSFFESGRDAGLSDTMIMDLAAIFGFDVDFALDIRAGDRFSVVYEELYKEGDKLRDGNILAAEFVNQGERHRVVRFADSTGREAFYTPEGQSNRKAFIRTPLDVFRISSHFNLKRKHPVLNRIRAHKGTDYAAPGGTPVRATGNGRVTFVGNKGGYGRTIVVQHGAQYETLYAHLSRYRSGVRAGSRIEQGQVIGYVGQSGLATGPHLHYEFRVNGRHKNPMTVPLPRANPIPASRLVRFRAETTPLFAQLDTLGRTQVAQAR